MAKAALTEAQRAKRKAVRLKAKAAASAAGKDWGGLSREERKSFRKSARKEMK